MTRQTGLAPITAREQLQKTFTQVGVQPLPKGSPGRASAAQVGITDADPITFFVIGDSGGIKAPGPQNAVSYAMQRTSAEPAFVYSVGDIVYFNGDGSEYQPQFYEAYGHMSVPIVGIPGNHDGDTTDDPSRAPLDTFMANFCSSEPAIPAADPHLEFGRHTETQPYCDWTLALEAVTITGVYSNVPSGGVLAQSQIDWLTGELKDAPTDRPLVVCLHHPPYSVDALHGGSQHMGDALDGVFKAAERAPDLVLSGHVHDYQRFTRTFGEWTIPYVVIGNSGYHNLHTLAPDAKPGEEVVDGVVLDYGDASEYGYLALTASAGKLSGSYTGVTPGTMPDGSDATVSAAKETF